MSLDEADRAVYDQISVLIKDKKVKIEAANVGRLKPSEVVAKVKENYSNSSLTINLHTCLCRLFSIRPISNAEDPFETNTEFCHYDEAHNDYVYQDSWVVFLTNLLQSGRVTPEQIRQAVKDREAWILDEYRIEQKNKI